MKISLRRALELAVGPANVDAAGHAVADWCDGRNCSFTGDVIREALRQSDKPAPDIVPHNRPDTSLRAELMQKLVTHREVLLNLCDRVDRLETRADGLTPIERVQRRWAKEAAGPAAGAEEPTPPAEGEVGELVAALRADAECIEAGSHDLCSITAEQLARTAELLQQRHPEPVPVSERPWNREGWCDAEGRCWLLTLEDGYPQWRLHSIKGVQLRNAMIMVTEDTIPMSFDSFWASHCLPFYALPLPAGEEA